MRGYGMGGRRRRRALGEWITRRVGRYLALGCTFNVRKALANP